MAYAEDDEIALLINGDRINYTVYKTECPIKAVPARDDLFVDDGSELRYCVFLG